MSESQTTPHINEQLKQAAIKLLNTSDEISALCATLEQECGNQLLADAQWLVTVAARALPQGQTHFSQNETFGEARARLERTQSRTATVLDFCRRAQSNHRSCTDFGNRVCGGHQFTAIEQLMAPQAPPIDHAKADAVMHGVGTHKSTS